MKFGTGHYSIHPNAKIVYTLSENEKTQYQRGFLLSFFFSCGPYHEIAVLFEIAQKSTSVLSFAKSPVYINDLDHSPRLGLLHFNSSNIHPIEPDKATQLRPPTARSLSKHFREQVFQNFNNCLHSQIIVLIHGLYLDKVAFVHVVASCYLVRSRLWIYIGGNDEKLDDAY